MTAMTLEQQQKLNSMTDVQKAEGLQRVGWVPAGEGNGPTLLDVLVAVDGVRVSGDCAPTGPVCTCNHPAGLRSTPTGHSDECPVQIQWCVNNKVSIDDIQDLIIKRRVAAGQL